MAAGEGFAIAIAQTLRKAGYDVYGIGYATIFEKFHRAIVLSPPEIASDFNQMAR